MLYADKRALETNLKARAEAPRAPVPAPPRRDPASAAPQVNLLAIREKELNYYTQNCQAVGTQAALLAGFAYSGLTQVAIPHDRAYALRIAYLLVTTTAMCFELIAVLNTTLLSMMGPGLALRGPDGSMHPAVDGMMTEYRTAYYCFVLGLVFFHFSAALFSWLIYVHWSVSTMARGGHLLPGPPPAAPALPPLSRPAPRLLPTAAPPRPGHALHMRLALAADALREARPPALLFEPRGGERQPRRPRLLRRVYLRFRLPAEMVITGALGASSGGEAVRGSVSPARLLCRRLRGERRGRRRRARRPAGRRRERVRVARAGAAHCEQQSVTRGGGEGKEGSGTVPPMSSTFVCPARRGARASRGRRLFRVARSPLCVCCVWVSLVPLLAPRLAEEPQR